MIARTPHDMTPGKVPTRVVSLVPSITRSMMDFGLAECIIGMTAYCEPGASVDVVRVGGTLTPNVDLILELDPDFVILNKEENPREIVAQLSDAGLELWITSPKTISDCIHDLWHIATIFGILERVSNTINALERAIAWLNHAREGMSRKRVFCPIWFDNWWMTINQDTYVHSVIELCGGDNIFANRERKYPLAADIDESEKYEEPGSRDVRYPRVTTEEVMNLEPELILLPDEPFPFERQELEKVKDLLRGTPAIHDDQIYLVDGRWLTWHGTTLVEAIRHLPQILQTVGSEGP